MDLYLVIECNDWSDMTVQTNIPWLQGGVGAVRWPPDFGIGYARIFPTNEDAERFAVGRPVIQIRRGNKE